MTITASALAACAANALADMSCPLAAGERAVVFLDGDGRVLSITRADRVRTARTEARIGALRGRVAVLFLGPASPAALPEVYLPA